MKRIRNDFHIHTLYSGHSGADMTVTAILQAARQAGLGRILVLEHSPSVNTEVRAAICDDAYDPESTDRAHLCAIAADCRRLAPKGSVPIVHTGAEIDSDPNRCDGTLLLRDHAGLDVIMASTHYLPNGRGFLSDRIEWPEPEKRRIYEEWFIWAMRVAANPDVRILAHPGALLCQLGIIGSFHGKVLDDFGKLLMVCKKYNTAFELNELLFRKKLNETQAATYHELIALARDIGTPIATGSDAHHLDEIGVFTRCEAIAERLDLRDEHFWLP